VAVAALLLGAWLLVAPRTPDLAAQVYRANLFGRSGLVVWDARWYGGHDMPGYSLLFPPLGWLLGVRLLGVLAALASTLLFARLAADWWGSRIARWPAALFAVCAAADVWIGRLSFALGVTFALAATLALTRRRTVPAALLAFVCAAASPVAGLLLVLAAATWSAVRRSPRELLAVGIPVGIVVLSLAALFPEGGFEPFPLRSFLAAAAVGLAFVWALPPAQRLLRIGGAVFVLGALVCLLVRSPMGSNVARYAALLAAPLLLGSLLAHGRIGGRGAAALCLIAVWVAWGPARETAAAGGEATSASYYAPLQRFLAGRRTGPVRVEVPLTRSHWEAALLAPSVSLARGWEKQLDERYDRVLIGSGLTASSYREWLRREAVAYVALPDAALDPPSAREGQLVRSGLPYLREVFASRHWRVYEVLGATPLLSGPGRLLAVGEDSLRLRAAAAGELLVRVRYSRYLTVTSGSGCAAAGPDGWTLVRARVAGPITVGARFSLAAALGGAGGCREG
jgi:hypothetical protein